MRSSVVAITHPTGDFDPEAMAGVRAVAKQAGLTILPRSREEVARFLDGLDIVDPGVVPVLSWRPDPQDTPPIDERSAYYWAGVARKG